VIGSTVSRVTWNVYQSFHEIHALERRASECIAFWSFYLHIRVRGYWLNAVRIWLADIVYYFLWYPAERCCQYFLFFFLFASETLSGAVSTGDELHSPFVPRLGES